MTPKPIRPDRLQELLPNLLAGTLTKDERDEVVLGHWRLANSIASKRAKRRSELADDLYGEARLALVEVVGAYKATGPSTSSSSATSAACWTRW